MIPQDIWRKLKKTKFKKLIKKLDYDAVLERRPC